MTGTSPAAATIHAGAVWVDGAGVLVRGPSGSGKSSLLLALLLADREQNRLIADDRVLLAVRAGRLEARAPAALAGLLEIRGQGIVAVPHIDAAPIELVVDIEPAERCPRLPEPADLRTEIEGLTLRRLAVPVGQPDGWIRVRAALAFRVAIV
ncbi:HPr kinase [Kaistia sp. 32K]|uniref:HPr kinase/phosphorylase n=1 Tax=Kaistia sp. 32K TaxID=2795690 RepID=UPI001915A159|nr:serine/threonine protein kinase [Kaistia sp. 32K]BCP55890.1 HPr kinase [Kaistia sp. 32K]